MSIFLNIHRSTDGGNSADYISGQYWNDQNKEWDWKPFPYRIPDAKCGASNFISPFVLDPNNQNRILAGGESLWRTENSKTPMQNDSGPKWSAIKPPVGSPISAIAIDPRNSDVIWVGHNNGGMCPKTIDGTSDIPVWKKVDESGSKKCPTIIVQGLCWMAATPMSFMLLSEDIPKITFKLQTADLIGRVSEIFLKRQYGQCLYIPRNPITFILAQK